MLFSKGQKKGRSQKNLLKIASSGENRFQGRQHRLRLEPLEDRRMLAVLHVDADALTGGDGLAWDSAYDDLQSALNQAELLNADTIASNDIDQIWIAEGTYLPSERLEAEDARSATFSLLNNVDLYGGFEGDETALEERDWTAHETILSGDLGIEGDIADNAYTVVYSGRFIQATLDCLSITGGNADGIEDSEHLNRTSGGGIYNAGSLTINNSTLFKNSAVDGGGIYNGQNSITMMTGCTIETNGAESGGGIYNDIHGVMTISDCSIMDNRAHHGGGIYHHGVSGLTSFMTITDSTIDANTAAKGGGIYNDAGMLTVMDSSISENVSNCGGLYNRLGFSNLTNTTISRNSGDGIKNETGDITLNGCTIQDNEQSGIDSLLTVFEDQIARNFSFVSINNSSISGNQASGIHNEYGKLDVNNSTISDNNDGGIDNQYGVMTVTGSTISNNLGGSGILNNSGKLSVVDSLITGNSGSQGGGIQNDGRSSLTVTGSTISGNTAGSGGGIYSYMLASVTVSESTIEGNWAHHGGGIWSEGGCTVLKSNIRGNTSFSGDGGGVSMNNAGFPLILTDCFIAENVAEHGNGGGVWSGTNSVITGCTFSANSASYGGGITTCNGYLYDMILENCIFDSNQAEGGGGAVHVYYGDLDLVNCAITGNTARRGGGIFSSGGNSLTLADCLIAENAATEQGGAIYNEGKTTFIASTISDNSAGEEGGAIYNPGTYSTLQLTDSSVTGNAAPLGGGIYNNLGTLAVEGSSISENDGSGVYNYLGIATITDTDLLGNSGSGVENESGEITLSGCTLSDHVQSGIENRFAIDESTGEDSETVPLATIIDSTINGNQNSGIVNHGTMTVEGASIYENSAKQGGGIHNSGNLVVTNSTVSGNQTLEGYRGGGIFNHCGEMTVGGSTISNNVNGSGISNYCSSILVVTNSLIAGNSGYRGGGINNERTSSLTVTGSTISRNTAIEDGGGIYSKKNSSLTVIESTVEGNSAEDGGGIWTDGNSTVLKSTIQENTSLSGSGGGIFHCNGILTVVNAEIYGNESILYGGGIFSSSSLNLINSTVVGNSSEYRGGGVYSGTTFTTALFVDNCTVTENAAEDSGGGIFIGSNLCTMNNSILTANQGGEVSGRYIPSGSQNLIGIAPGFVRAPSDGGDGWGDDPLTSGIDESANDDYGDLRLTATSPAIDMGDSALLPTDKSDMDGDGNTSETIPQDLSGGSRVVGDSVDIGAYEYQASPATGRETASTVVTTAADTVDLYDQAISLREALLYADRGALGTDLTFSGDLDGQTITLNGQALWVDKSVTIDASSLSTLTIDADAKSRGFHVFGEEVKLVGLTITGGVTPEASFSGGGIYNIGDLTVEDCTLVGNSAETMGGGIHNQAFGALTVLGSTFSQNTAFDGGGIFSENFQVSDSFFLGNSVARSGGGIRCGGGTIDNCVFSGNTAVGGYGGGLSHSCNALSRYPLKITGSTFSGNSAKDGGGVAVGSDSILEDTVISENEASNWGGGIWIAGREVLVVDCLIEQNSAYAGGGIYIRGMTTVSNSLVRENESLGGSGGGVWNSSDGTLVLYGSSLVENRSKYGSGGGIKNQGDLTVLDSTFEGNSAPRGAGGGIFRFGGTLVVTGSTFSGNSAKNRGGGISSYDKEVTVTNCTLSGNSAEEGGAICNQYGTLTLNNSLVYGNVGVTNPDVYSNASQLAGSLVGVDPQFARDPSDGGDGWGDDPYTNSVDEGANDDYGDLRLRPDSSAIDAGDNGVAVDAEGNPLLYDLDGNPRVQNGTVDIGAHEWVPLLKGDFNEDGVVNANDFAFLISNWQYGTENWGDADPALTPRGCVAGDINYDAKVNAGDFAYFMDNWQRSMLTVSSPIEDLHLVEGDQQPALIDLKAIFESTSELIYSVESSNPELVMAEVIDGRWLQLTYLPYSEGQDRTPAVITVTGGVSLMGGPVSASDQFTVNVELPVTVPLSMVASQAAPMTAADWTLDDEVIMSLALDLHQHQSTAKKSDEQQFRQEKLMAVAYADYE